MKLSMTGIGMAILAMGLMAVQAVAEEAPALKSTKDKTSYGIGASLGANLAMNFKQQAIEINPEVLAKGFKDALTGGKLMMTEDELRTVMMAFQAEMQKKQAEMQKNQAEAQGKKADPAAAEANKKAGEAFLAKNKTEKGVVTLPSGLQYKILKEGKGPKPKASDTVECNYKGTLIDGTVFDASDKHGGPQTFPVTGVIKGWTEALQLMPVGSKWQLFIPSNLAYGEAGQNQIGPNAMLIFDIELVAIK